MMRRRVVRALVAVAVALVVGANVLISLTGCSAISSGTITGKHYSPPWVSTTTSCYSTGKSTICMPQVHYWPATYRLDLRNGDKSGWVDVDQGTFDQENVGDWWGARS